MPDYETEIRGEDTETLDRQKRTSGSDLNMMIQEFLYDAKKKHSELIRLAQKKETPVLPVGGENIQDMQLKGEGEDPARFKDAL